MENTENTSDLINERDKISKKIIDVNVKLSQKNISWRERRKLKKEANNLIKEFANIVCKICM